MILEVHHRTTYRYESSVDFSQHLVRLKPRPMRRQRLMSHQLNLSPSIADSQSYTDAFGNAVRLLTLSDKHDRLSIESVSMVETTRREPFLAKTSEPWELVRDVALGILGDTRGYRDQDGFEAATFAFPSLFTAANDAIEDYALESFTPGRPMLEAAEELCGRIFRDFAYTPGATTAQTRAKEAMDLQKGVCQDFAHVMLAAMRALNLPVRYVSGYVVTHPPEGQERLVGADASHAWVGVWSPTFGWVDLDPTNDLYPDLEHVTLAIGRDYADVTPVVGVVLGGGAQILDVAVDVVPLKEQRAPMDAATASERLP